MDLDLLRTFVEVHRTRHFGRAAERLHLTQSAVSSRIRLLEQTLGMQLFTRDRRNIQLTPAGERFLIHAETIIDAWHEAQRDVATAREGRRPVTLAAPVLVWDIHLGEWMGKLHPALPELSFMLHTADAETVVSGVLEGGVELGFLLDVPRHSGLIVRELGAVALWKVAARCRRGRAGLIGVDWGAAVAARLADVEPGIAHPGLQVSGPAMALDALLKLGGEAYLPRPLVQAAVKAQTLTRLESPPLAVPLNAIYRAAGNQRDLAERILELLAPARA